jgi:predicted metal-dependent phosphotriesterase family hydrolase
VTDSLEVMTVLGPIPAAQLGVTLPHEHLLVDFFRVSMNGDGILDDVPLAIDEVAQFKANGGRTIVEVTSGGLGRQPADLKRISEATGVHIVMGSGWYKERFFGPEVYETPTHLLADMIVRDLTEGVDGTGIRAGIIGEVGSMGSYIAPSEERVMRAAARAHRRTGVAIMTHAIRSPVGLDQLDILAEEGADLRRIIIGHCDSYPEPDYHEAIARRGAFVEFDRVQGKHEWETAKRAALVLSLVEKGYIEHVLLAQDICEKSSLRAYGGQGYSFVITHFAARLRAAGLSDAQLHTILVENPRAALSGSRY